MDSELPNMRLSGPLPPELGKLEQLQYMYALRSDPHEL